MMWQTLAPELIYEVLRQYDADFKISITLTQSRPFPWYLGHICKTWREVFVSSPQFWNTLNIVLDFSPNSFSCQWPVLFAKPSEQSRERALEVTMVSLARSRDCPISFRLCVSGYSRALPAEVAMCRQMIGMLVANSVRWHAAYIDLPANEMATIYAARNRMPLLRSIQLELQTIVQDDNTTVQSCDAAKLYNDFLVGAEQLTRICFNDHINSGFWKINWSLITIIHFSIVPPLSQLLAYLSRMSCLKELVFFMGCHNTSNDTIVPITLSHLESLYSPAALLPVVDTPVLQELHIRNDTSMYWNEHTLEANVSRYFQPMRHLSKLEISGYDYDAALILEHMPRVDHLTLESCMLFDLLEVLGKYPQMGFLKTVTFMFSTRLSGFCESETARFLKIITSWKRETGENRGIGPFHNLTEMSFNLLNAGFTYKPWRQVVERSKLHLAKQGIHCSISELELSELSSVPRFDVL